MKKVIIHYEAYTNELSHTVVEGMSEDPLTAILQLPRDVEQIVKYSVLSQINEDVKEGLNEES
jgi:hypothetical protein